MNLTFEFEPLDPNSSCREVKPVVVAQDTNSRSQVRRFEAWLLSTGEEKLDSPAVVNDSVTSTACSALDVFPGGLRQ